jgi:lipoate-protein ligase A
MFFIDNSGITDPSLNLALEEYCLRKLDPQQGYLLLYINGPAVILGRSQNAFREINLAFVRRKGIHVVRRISGGGAVYHDHGNLNFSFITKYQKTDILNFGKFTAPVIRALQKLGLPAELSERNDIVAFGRKISGNAQYYTQTSMVSHGTLLFDAEMENLEGALNGKEEKIESRGVQSVKSRVTNIAEHLERPIDIDTFKKCLLHSILEAYGGVREKKLTDKDWEDIHRLSEEKYRTWHWNYGKSPECRISRIARLDTGRIDVRIRIKEGIIKEIEICGDFFRSGDKKRLAAALTGRRYDVDEITRVLRDIAQYLNFGLLTPARFADYLCGYSAIP